MMETLVDSSTVQLSTYVLLLFLLPTQMSLYIPWLWNGLWPVTKCIRISSVFVLGYPLYLVELFVFGFTALLPLITCEIAVLVIEQRVLVPTMRQSVPSGDPGFLERSKQNMIQLLDAVKKPNVFLPTLFIFLWQASFMTVLVLAARLCLEGMEATLFATLTSVSTGGHILGWLIGSCLSPRRQ